ncbi:MAG: hypothetical protein JXR83_06780 [Deltaproteobacteria bacterium]|nr:hypothetical protein [Deltaproteobacteria bacterium]
MRNRKTLALLAALALCVGACDQTIEDTDAGAGTDGGADAGGGSCIHSGAGVTVQVNYGGNQLPVDFSCVADTEFSGAAHKKLSDVILAAVTDRTIDQLKIDDLLAPGYSPTMRSNCDGMLPVSGANSELGFVLPATRDLVWDGSLMYPGCMNVDGLEEIRVSDQ